MTPHDSNRAPVQIAPDLPLPAHHGSSRNLWTACLLVTGILSPIMIAVWTVPGFSTQDGPTHLYNATILARSFRPASPFRDYYQVRWQPLPNWAGHLALAGLIQVVKPATADRIIITLTLAGFALAQVWLRWNVRGDEALFGSCLMIANLAPNFLWLLGFTSFVLGCSLVPVTLGVWWGGRDRLGAGRLLLLAILLVLGYFCHLVSLALTVAGLGFLALIAPARSPAAEGRPAWFQRLLRTACCFLPLLPLAILYKRLSSQGGPMNPVWPVLTGSDLLKTLLALVARLGWVDPLTLSKKMVLPFTERTSALYAVFAPVLWFCLALLICLAGSLLTSATQGTRSAGFKSLVQRVIPSQNESSTRGRGVWLLCGGLMLLAAILGPDSLGSEHGHFLAPRVALLGLAMMVQAIDIRVERLCGRLAAACLVVAVTLQSVIVWDYAFYCKQTTAQIIQASDLVGRGQRVAPLLTGIRSRFRPNPLLHADSWLGVGTGNILWSNYEARYYYFPVQFRPGLDRPDPWDFEQLSLDSDRGVGEECTRLWEQTLSRHFHSIDRVVAWKRDPLLDAITERWFEFVAERGDVRVFAPRHPSR